MGFPLTDVDALPYYREQDALQRAEIKKLRRVLLQAAPSHQGGHSTVGARIAEALSVPFPIEMKSLEAQAKYEGLDPDELWPWLKKMRSSVHG